MIGVGPAGAPCWFEQRIDRLYAYLDYIRLHGATCIEFVVHGGTPGRETERVHLPQPNRLTAIEATQARGLTIHLHAPLTPEYRLGNWAYDARLLMTLYGPIAELLVAIGRTQQIRPVLVLHGASSASVCRTDGE